MRAIVALMSLLLFVGGMTFSGAQIDAPIRSERRKLAEFPDASVRTVLGASFFRDLDNFMKDRLFGRLWFVYAYGELIGNWRRDLVYGRDGFVFYRVAVEPYTKQKMQQSTEDLESGFRRIASVATAQGKKVFLEIYRNKAFIYPDKLPAIWQHYVTIDAENMPFNRVGRRLADEGFLTVIDHTRTLQTMRNAGKVAFTPVEENHSSPEAFFLSMKETLDAIGANTGKRHSLPDEYPSRTNSTIVGGNGYLNAHHIIPTVPEAVGVKIGKSISMPGGMIYTFDNPISGSSLLPKTIVYSNSFFATMINVFGGMLFPQFSSVVFHYSDDGIEGWDDADVVILSFCDQGLLEYVPPFLHRLADDLERNSKSGRQVSR